MASTAIHPRTAGSTRARLTRSLTQYYFLPAAALSVILLIANLLIEPNFGWKEQIATFAPVAIAAMASMPSIVSGGGGIDLSISPTMILITAVYVQWLVPHSLGGPALAIPLLLALGAAVGMVNGLMIALLRLTPIVATLCTYFVLAGVNLLIAPSPQQLHDDWTRNLVGDVVGIPVALGCIAAPILVWFALSRTAFLRSLFAVGSNDTAAYSAGLPVTVLRVSAYALGGLFAAIGGIAVVALVGSVDASTSTVYTVSALVAVAIGGIALEGGRGGIVGPLCGAAVTYLLGTFLTQAHIAQQWLQVVNGVLLVAAVIFSKQLSRSGKGQA